MSKGKGATPIIIGYSTYEGNQFAYLALKIVTNSSNPPLNATYNQYVGILRSSLPFTLDVTLQVAKFYAPLSVDGNYYVPLREVLGDYGIKCGSSSAMYSALAGFGADVYTYYFRHNTVNWRMAFLNATHTVEVPYVFLSNGTVSEAQFNPQEEKLARGIVKYLGNFQDTYNPNNARRWFDNKDEDEDEVSGPALPDCGKLPEWPSFRNTTERNTTLAWDFDFPRIQLPVPPSCAVFWTPYMVNRYGSTVETSPSSESIFDYEKFLTNPELNLFHG